MKTQNTLILAQADFQKLSSLVETANYKVVELLDEELSRAEVVADEKLPNDVVAMNSTVLFQDVDSGQEKVVTLVYPHEANIEENKVSILTPVGMALIGLRVGQVINWPLPNGTERKFKVLSVLEQNNNKSA